jgi:hypothetical protein
VTGQGLALVTALDASECVVTPPAARHIPVHGEYRSLPCGLQANTAAA